MSFVLVHKGGDKIILDKSFAESIAKELKDKNISTGTILLTATEFWLDPTYVFKYNKPNDVEFPGRYDIVIAANIFNSNGGSINLTGSTGRTPRKPKTPPKAPDSTAIVTDGDDFPTFDISDGFDALGGDNGIQGGPGNSITLYCNELVNVEVFANGGLGGKGGRGGDGDEGGDQGRVKVKGKLVKIPPAEVQMVAKEEMVGVVEMRVG
jgi:hypothetical protein